jgi:hypothetical protein
MTDTEAFYPFRVEAHPNAIYGHLRGDNGGAFSFNLYDLDRKIGQTKSP